MKVLVVGKGGREHALVQALLDSPSRPRVLIHPGSDAIARIAPRLDAPDFDGLLVAAKREGVDLIVAGEEKYLEAGLADKGRAQGFAVFGPVKQSAQLETSKQFAKEFLRRNQVPTGDCKIAHTAEQIRTHAAEFPVVLKFDGLAAGKGVVICQRAEDVEDFIERVFVKREFGEPKPVLIEEFLSGKEVSVICAVADGDFLAFPPARDHKRLQDRDEGPNTGGMGAVATMELVTPGLFEEIKEDVIRPTMAGLLKDKLDYRGFLYFGLILTGDGPKVLEFNCRFGDPEAQAVLPLVTGDFAAFLKQAAEGRIASDLIAFRPGWSVGIILAAGSYPYQSGQGDVIDGLEEITDCRVYHSGTKRREDGRYETAGGRILCVVGHGERRITAVQKVYDEARKIQFHGMQYRRDIGRIHFD